MTKAELIQQIEKLEKKQLKSFKAIRNLPNQEIIRQSESYNQFTRVYSFNIKTGLAARVAETTTGRVYQRSLTAMKKADLEAYYEDLLNLESMELNTAAAFKKYVAKEKRKIEDLFASDDYESIKIYVNKINSDAWEKWARYYEIASEEINDLGFLPLNDFAVAVANIAAEQEAVDEKQPRSEYASFYINAQNVNWFISVARGW